LSDDTARELQTLAINLGATGDEVAQLVQASIGLSSALGTDASGAMMALNKAMQGEWAALQKVFPALRRMNSEQEKLAYIQNVAARGFSEQLSAANTLSGTIGGMGIQFGELKEAVGNLIAIPLEPWMRNLSEAIRSLTTGSGLERLQLGLKKAGLEFAKIFGKATQEDIDAVDRQINEAITRDLQPYLDMLNRQTKAFKERTQAAQEFNRVTQTDARKWFQDAVNQGDVQLKELERQKEKREKILNIDVPGEKRRQVVVPENDGKFKMGGGLFIPDKNRLEMLQSQIEVERDRIAQTGRDTGRLAELEARARQVRERDPMMRQPTGANLQQIDISEALQRTVGTPQRPLTVKSDMDGKIYEVLQKVADVLPLLQFGRFSN
jgi:hypothetical protein